NRTAGTLIGGGVGALAGAAIGNASDRKKCEAWWASRSQYQGGYYQGGYPGGYSTTWHQGGYGYGYYTPGVVVTTIITNGAPVVTETVETSTRTYYENVPVRKRYVAKKKWKPKPKPRCVC
ncbi:MAG TPA: glycine zipper domain-containing protein, partial [Sphingopyxis sp.]|uniref:glycine zipper domain-containing protein n=1 Tax=Sphingopyxis sp. TaxID=1908224 RepID=UPI002CC1E94F